MSELDVVTVRRLRKSYGGRAVVDGLDLDVRAGQVVGLIGANGAGKTTTVECIQGLRWSFALAQLVVGLAAIAVGSVILLAVAAPVYGVPALHHPWLVVIAVVLGAVAFVSIGVLLGTVLPSARAAQAVGLILFFPSFLLGSGGPPPQVMGSALRGVARFLPLTW